MSKTSQGPDPEKDNGSSGPAPETVDEIMIDKNTNRSVSEDELSCSHSVNFELSPERRASAEDSNTRLDTGDSNTN